jgi:preprotein translocase subunit SecG
MQTFVTVIHIFSCVFVILLVLIQTGKGAEVSASFGGSSQTVFGSSGGANFFVKLTSFMAGAFMLTSLALTILGARANRSAVDGAALPPPVAPPAAQQAPAAPAPEAAKAPQATAPATETPKN